MILFSGNANKALSQKIADALKRPLGKSLITQFKDGESRIEISEAVQGADVFIIQPTSYPCNHHLMELLLMVDALRHASPKRITAVIPYFGYARQDKGSSLKHVPISAKAVADLLATMGIQRVLTLDLHVEQLEGFFSCPIDALSSASTFLNDIQQKGHDNPLIVSSDVGGVVRARTLAKLFNNVELAIIDKRRPKPNEAQVIHVIGAVAGRDCIIVDDLIDTGTTICLGAKALKEKGAKKVTAYVTHPVLSEGAVALIKNSVLDELVVTDSIILKPEVNAVQKIRQISIATLLAKAIHEIHHELSSIDN